MFTSQDGGAKKRHMPHIEVSQRLYDHLVAQAARGHGGNIHDFLFSRFLSELPPESNEDRRILLLLEAPDYRAERTAKRRYQMVLLALHRVDPTRFSTLNDFRPPNWERVILSKRRSSIERTTTSEGIEQIFDLDWWCLVGFPKEQYRAFVFQLMRAMHYPLPVATQIRNSIEDYTAIDDLLS